MIRPFEPRDVAGALRVFRDSCIPSHPFLKPEFMRQTEQKLRERTLLEFETTVIDDGGIRAFLCHRNAFVEALFVEPAFQRRGLGKALLDHLKARVKVVRLSVFAQNSRAIKFYQREDFWTVKLSEHHDTKETIVLFKWERK